MPLYIEQSEDLDRSHGCLTHSQTLKDRATHKVSEWSSRNAISNQNVFTPLSIVTLWHCQTYVCCHFTFCALYQHWPLPHRCTLLDCSQCAFCELLPSVPGSDTEDIMWTLPRVTLVSLSSIHTGCLDARTYTNVPARTLVCACSARRDCLERELSCQSRMTKAPSHLRCLVPTATCGSRSDWGIWRKKSNVVCVVLAFEYQLKRRGT